MYSPLHTKGRMLRANLLQPLNSKTKIEERFDAAEELLQKPEITSDLRKSNYI